VDAPGGAAGAGGRDRGLRPRPGNRAGRPAPPAAAAPTSLAGVEWQLVRVVGPDRDWRPPAGVDAVLRFDGQGGFSATACNHFGGPVRVAGHRLRLGQMVSTSMGCGGPAGSVERAFLAVMDGEVGWAVEAGELRLDKPDGRGLRFRERDTIYPGRDLRPLLRGRRDGGDYRLGYSVDQGSAALSWEWRDGPGRPWGYAGMNRELAWPVPRPDAMAGDAADGRFVFGVVDVRTARAAYLPPGGRPAVQLERFDLAAARGWWVFGGFVPERPGGIVIAYDATGRELSRSLPVR
jgi:heat shock protein HslJ